MAGWGAAIAAIANLAGTGVNANMQWKGMKDARKAARFNPWSVNSLMANTTFDRDGRQVNMQLTPEFQKIFDEMMSNTQGLFSQANLTDPDEIASKWYGKMSALSQPDEMNQRMDLENRLFSQGMLGSSGGSKRFGALEDSIGNKGLARELQALTFGQDFQSKLFNQALQGLQGLTAMDHNAFAGAQLGSQIGGRNAAIGSQMAPYIMGAYGNMGNAASGFANNLGSAFANWSPNNSTAQSSSQSYGTSNPGLFSQSDFQGGWDI